MRIVKENLPLKRLDKSTINDTLRTAERFPPFLAKI